MTREEILRMPAGREMDALIAVVVGWVIEDATAISPTGSKWARNVHGDDGWLPYYSTDIAAAWNVYEKLIADCKPNNGEPDFIMLNAYPDGTFYVAKAWEHHDGDIVEFELIAETAPLAICRAALLTTLEEQ